jgi:hypothetical protein
MASGAASYSVSATNYGRLANDSYFVLSAPGVVNGNQTITGDLVVQGRSDLVGNVTCGASLDVAGQANVANLGVSGAAEVSGSLTAGATTVTALASSGNVVLSGTASLIAAGGVIGASVTSPSVNATSELIGNLATLAQLQGAFLDQTQPMVYGSVYGCTSIKLGRLKIVFGTAGATDSQVALGSCSFSAGTSPCVIAFGVYPGAGNGYYVNCTGPGSTGSMATSLAFHGTSQSGSGFSVGVSFIAWAYQ